MSKGQAKPIIATVLTGVVILAALIGYVFISTNSTLSSMSSQNSSLSGQNAGLQEQIANDNQQVASLNQQISSMGQQLSGSNNQLAGLSQQVSALQQRTQTVVTVSNTIVSAETIVSVEMETSTSTTTSTVTSVTAIPQSVLVIVGSTYNNSTTTFTFQVQNTQNYTVYAQLTASLWGQVNFGCDGQVGTFVSQVYTFAPQAMTTTQLNLGLSSYSGFCGGNPLSSIDVTYVIPQSTAISLTYTFIVVPNYVFP